MANRPSRPEIITVNSEQLQTVIRDLLPSQAGFGSELQATNVITPIIDLTPAAEGSGVRVDLQTAIAFGSATAISVNNALQALTSNAGWYRCTGTATVSAAAQSARFDMTDGSTSKIVWSLNTAGAGEVSQEFDLVFAVATGITLNAVASSTANMVGSFRQIANAQGELVNPVGLPI
jgi:hypothetical protein